MQILGHLKLQKIPKNITNESLADVPKMMAKKGLIFPFYLKLGLAISLLSVTVAGGSLSLMYSRTQGSILKDLSEELQAIGIKETAKLTPEDITEISQLSNQIAANSLNNPQLILEEKIAANGLKNNTVKTQIIE